MLWKLWALLLVLLAASIYVGATSKAPAMNMQHAPAKAEVNSVRVIMHGFWLWRTPWLVGPEAHRPLLFPAHGDLSWPAEFEAKSGAKCCKGETATGAPGDCTYLPDGVGDELTVGSKIEVDYPRGRETTTITNIFPTQDRMGRRVICSPGCLFTEEKV